MERNSKKDLLVTLSVLLAIVFIVNGVILTKKKPAVIGSVAAASTTVASTNTDFKPPNATAAITATDKVPAPASNSGYADGTYTATGSYSTPENSESITVNITLKDGIVTDTSAAASARSRESKEYSSAFVQNYKPLVVGKSIASIRLSRVSGSSLTSQGFNNAIAAIQNQAKS